MALTTDDLHKIEQLLKGVATKADLKHEIDGVRTEMNEGFETVTKTLRGEMIDGFDNILKTMDEHMPEDDRRFMSDRKRIARLEKIVL